MLISRHDRPVAFVNLLYIVIFTWLSLRRENYEFLLYAGIIIVLFALILIKQRALKFNGTILWGLTVWGLMHMAGGNVRVGDGILYEVQLIQPFLRFDQLVHFLGFGTATLVCHHLLKPHLREATPWSPTLIGLIVMMGVGVGGLNEIVEFIAVGVIPETGVGGYENTLWDMVFNLFGACAAVALLRIRHAEADA